MTFWPEPDKRNGIQASGLQRDDQELLENRFNGRIDRPVRKYRCLASVQIGFLKNSADANWQNRPHTVINSLGDLTCGSFHSAAVRVHLAYVALQTQIFDDLRRVKRQA